MAYANGGAAFGERMTGKNMGKILDNMKRLAEG